MEPIDLKKDRKRRLALSLVLGRVAQRALIIIVAITIFPLLTFLLTHSLYQAVASGALAYVVSIVTLIVLDVLRYGYETPDRIFEKVLRRFLRTNISSEKRERLREEFEVRLKTSYLKDILIDQGLRRGLRQTMVEQLDEAIRILRYVEERLADDPESSVTMHAVQVSSSESDEEFNYWRSLKAVQYLNQQRELLRRYGSRVHIQRFFITDPGELNIKALAVIANHRYWGIRTSWGIRGRCHLPFKFELPAPRAGNRIVSSVKPSADLNRLSRAEALAGLQSNDQSNTFSYLNALLISFEGKVPFKVAILGEVPKEGELYNDTFVTYWSVYDAATEEPFSVALWNQVKKALEDIREGSILEMDDGRIDQMLREETEQTNARIDDVINRIGAVLTKTTEMTAEKTAEIHEIAHILKIRKYDYPRGYYAFRRVRNQIPDAQSIVAVDVTSVKRSLSILRQNPGYLEWQDACFNQIKQGVNRRLSRCYLLDQNKPDTIEHFIEILSDYFARFGTEILPDNVNLYYTSIDKLYLAVNLMEEDELQEWLESKVENIKYLVIDHLSRGGLAAADQLETLEGKRLVLSASIARDFLYTEHFIYDYVNPDAKVDQTGPDDYKFIERQYESNFTDLRAEYSRAFSFLLSRCGATQIKNKKTVEADQISQSLALNPMLMPAEVETWLPPSDQHQNQEG
jgi:hypothetical protein